MLINEALGSTYEMSLRILILLNEFSDYQFDEFLISEIDFIAVYGEDFGLLDENLHGYGNYRFSEYSARKSIVFDTLNILVLKGLVTFIPNSNGFQYQIASLGQAISQKLSGEYADEYRLAVHTVADYYSMNSSSMLQDINSATLRYLKEIHNE